MTDLAALRPAGFENVGNLDCDLTDDDHTAARADPLLETITNALRDAERDWIVNSEEDWEAFAARAVLAALLSAGYAINEKTSEGTTYDLGW